MIKQWGYAKHVVHRAIAHSPWLRCSAAPEQWPPASFPPGDMLSMRPQDMEYLEFPFGLLGSAVLALSPPHLSCPPPAYLLGVRSWKILALVWALLSNHWISTLFSPWVHKSTLSQLKSGHTLFRANYNNSDPPGFMKPGHLYTSPWQNVARDILMKSQKSGIVN